jgi:ATP-dependent Clp protease protease subunit
MRYALTNARVMIHQPYGGVSGQFSDIEIQAAEIMRARDVLNDILAMHTGQPKDRIVKDTDRDFFLGAAEAKEYGLVDEVLKKTPAPASDETKD